MGCRRRWHGHHQHDASGRRIRWPQRVRGEFTEKLIEIIRQHGTITRRKLQQRIRGRYRTQEINDMLTQAVEAGLIVRTSNGYAAGIMPWERIGESGNGWKFPWERLSCFGLVSDREQTS